MTAQELKTTLRERGVRMTPQRRLILDAVANAQGHISVDQIYQQVVRQFPEVNVSTVYRTMDVLEELGLVRHTHFHDGVARYHRATEEPHQHLICRGCGRDIELDLALLEPLAEELFRRYGFKAELDHAAFVGLCRACQAGASQ